MSALYPVPSQPPRPAPLPKVITTAFLPAAPTPDVELPPLVMAPLSPPGWNRP